MERECREGCPGSLRAVVRARREEAGLTQRELAARTGMSVGAVRDIEQGRTDAPRQGSLARLAGALGLDDAYLQGLIPPRAGARDAAADDGLQPAAGSAGLVVAVLGPLAAWRDGARVPLGPVRQRGVLGLLALHQDTGLSRAALIDALWGEKAPAAAVGMLQGYMSRLRRLTGLGVERADDTPAEANSGALSWDGTGYRFSGAGIGTDLSEFAETLGRARAAGIEADAETARGWYARALGLWRGEPLEDVDLLRGHPSVVALSRQRAAAVLEYADAAAAAGVPGQAIDELRALADREPLDERVYTRLMMALAATGQQAAALAAYEEVRQRLDQDLGIRPGAELAEAHVRVLRQEVPAAAGGLAGTPAQPAAVPQRPVPRQLPALSANFTGRAREMAMLDGLLDQEAGTPGAVTISVITGTAGVGKTALAVCWAHRAAPRFPDGQLYVNLRGFGPAGSPLSAEEAIRAFLGALHVPPEQIPSGLTAQAGLFRSLLANRRMLVVLDNARDADQVRSLLPASLGCLVIVTSRSQLTGLAAAEGVHLVTLDVLSRADARALLARRLGADRLSASAVADELIELCARLPLALSVAAASVHPGFPLASIVAELRDVRHRLDALDTGEPSSGVRAVISWSYQGLSQPGARLFRLLAVHPGADLTEPAAASLAGVSLREARRMLRELARASLVTEHAPGRFGCHDLLRAYAVEQAQEETGDTDRRAALRRILDYYLHSCIAVSALVDPDPARENVPIGAAAPGVLVVPAGSRRQALAWLEDEYQGLVAAISQAARAGFDAHAWQLSWAIEETVLYRQGRWHDLETTQQAALQAAARLGDTAGLAYALRGLGRAHVITGSLDEGRSCLSRAIALFEQIEDPAGQARAHVYLGLASGRQGRYDDALIHAGHARCLFEAAGQQAGQAGALNNIGWYHLQLGHYEQAAACAQRAARAFGDLGDMRGAAIALDTLGCACRQMGRHDQATAWAQRALTAIRGLGDLRSLAGILANLGEARHAAGDHPGARQAWAEALSTLQDHDSAEARQLRARLTATKLSPGAQSPHRSNPPACMWPAGLRAACSRSRRDDCGPGP
jgi:DNA-binding SARP family transcriptional activator